MRAVFSGRLPDRVPFLATIFTDHACQISGRRFEEALIDPALGNRCMVEAAVRCGCDGVRLRIGPGDDWYRAKEVREHEGRLMQFDRSTGRAEGFYDVDGGGGLVLFEPPKPVASIEEVRAIPVPSSREYVERGCVRNVAECVAEAHGKGLFAIGMCGGQTINFMVQQLGDPEDALMCFHDRPELAFALIEKAVAITTEMGKALIETGLDCIYIGDSYASASVISPATYERFCVPAYRQAAAEFRGRGVFCYKHCCGNYDPLLESLPAVGVDAMDGIDPSSGMSVAHTKSVLGEKLTLMGGIACLTLLDGTVEEVYDEARRCVEAGKPGGRYILGSACAVPRNAPVENLRAAAQAAIDFGTY